jgi:hypothetical protein
VQPIFKGLVARAYENSSSAPAFVLKCITSHCQVNVKSNPTSMTITQESLEKYTASWFKMLCPLLRDRDDLEESCRVNLNRILLNTSGDEKQQNDFLELCIQFLQSKIYLHNNPPPLIKALAMCGFDCSASSASPIARES